MGCLGVVRLGNWGGELRISYRERLLGIYLGCHATIEDQYLDAMTKFEKTMAIFVAAQLTMSLPVRVLTVNVFLAPLFAYQNRHFFMPARLLREVEARMLRFISPVVGASWECSALLTNSMASGSVCRT